MENDKLFLEDCLVVERIAPFISTTRRRLVKIAKYLFFDLGIRRLSTAEGLKLPLEHLGRLFVSNRFGVNSLGEA